MRRRPAAGSLGLFQGPRSSSMIANCLPCSPTTRCLRPRPRARDRWRNAKRRLSNRWQPAPPTLTHPPTGHAPTSHSATPMSVAATGSIGFARIDGSGGRQNMAGWMHTLRWPSPPARRGRWGRTPLNCFARVPPRRPRACDATRGRWRLHGRGDLRRRFARRRRRLGCMLPIPFPVLLPNPRLLLLLLLLLFLLLLLLPFLFLFPAHHEHPHPRRHRIPRTAHR